HLPTKPIDKEPIMDWRDLQAIKSQLCGAEAEAMQLFPAESRLVDTSEPVSLVGVHEDGRQAIADAAHRLDDEHGARRGRDRKGEATSARRQSDARSLRAPGLRRADARRGRR